MNNFQYEADYDFFLNRLANNNISLFKAKFSNMFDFRDPKIKRAEFNKIRNKVYKELVLKFGEKCQLNLCEDCSKENLFDVDHYIPLSSNKLNKLIRHLKAVKGKKVATQSFGSNDISNLKIACKRCNSIKKHKIIFK